MPQDLATIYSSDQRRRARKLLDDLLPEFATRDRVLDNLYWVDPGSSVDLKIVSIAAALHRLRPDRHSCDWPEGWRMITPVYYFGCWNHAGHYLHEPGGRSLSRDEVGPFDVYGKAGLPLDGKFTPGPHPQYGTGGLQDESFVALTHVRGWTVMAMWDHSVDTRGGSNAAFITEGSLTHADMWRLARAHFPHIVARLKAAPPIDPPSLSERLAKFVVGMRENARVAKSIANPLATEQTEIPAVLEGAATTLFWAEQLDELIGAKS